MIKMIISDMDGTLLDDKGHLPYDFKDTMEKLKDKNILFVPASGRQCANLLEVFNDYKDNMCFIAENGAYTLLQEGKSIEKTIDSTLVKDILKTIKAIPNIKVILGGKKGAYIEKGDTTFKEHAFQYYKNVRVVKDFNEVDDDIIKFAIYNDMGIKGDIKGKFEQYEGKAQLVFGAEKWLDITALYANKGSAIKGIQEALNIKNTETVCFGDYLNDLSMFDEEICYHRYAMKNAHPELKKLANHIAPSNKDYGVTKTINNILLKNTY